MIAYRVADIKYAPDLSGEGAALYGGRWNPAGFKALYTSQFISLCILEILLRTDKKINPPNYQLITIEFPQINMAIINSVELKMNWKNYIEYTQWTGEEFLKQNNSLAMQIPSAIVEKENNYLLNPLHKDFNKVKIISVEPLELDNRLQQI